MKRKTEKTPTLYMYVGIAQKQKENVYIASVILHAKDVTPIQLKPIQVDSSEKKKEDRHRVLLEALLYTLESIAQVDSHPFRVVFFANDELLVYEYSKEYLSDGRFSKNTRDLNLWNEIVTTLKTTGLKLEIVGKDESLSVLNDMERRRKRGRKT